MQNDTVCFQIVEESVTEYLPNGIALHAWEMLSKKLQSMIGASNTILRKKFAKIKLDDVTRDP